MYKIVTFSRFALNKSVIQIKMKMLRSVISETAVILWNLKHATSMKERLKKRRKNSARYILKLYTIFREEFREAEILVNQNNT